MDIVSLYPSIDQAKSAEMVKQLFMALDILEDNVENRAASLYLAWVVPAEELHREGLTELVPRRRQVRGRCLGPSQRRAAQIRWTKLTQRRY